MSKLTKLSSIRDSMAINLSRIISMEISESVLFVSFRNWLLGGASI